MVRIGFVVEGDCEEILVKSDHFRKLAAQYHLEICKVVNIRGRGNLCPRNISTSIAIEVHKNSFVRNLRGFQNLGGFL